jgi:hypothetical protein
MNASDLHAGEVEALVRDIFLAFVRIHVLHHAAEGPIRGSFNVAVTEGHVVVSSHDDRMTQSLSLLERGIIRKNCFPVAFLSRMRQRFLHAFRRNETRSNF